MPNRIRTSIFILIISSGVFAQGIVCRLGYSYGPEYGILLLPPVAVSLEYQFTKERNTSYIGLCTGGNLGVEISGAIGLYNGYRYKNFFFENKLNWYLWWNIPNSPDDQFTKNSQFSINPKVGLDFNYFYIKAGPHIPIHKNEDNYLNLKYLKINNTLITVEMGFRIHFSWLE